MYLIQGKLEALWNLFETGSFEDFGGAMANFGIPLGLGGELDAELCRLKQTCRGVEGSQWGLWVVSKGFEHLQVVRVAEFWEKTGRLNPAVGPAYLFFGTSNL